MSTNLTEFEKIVTLITDTEQKLSKLIKTESAKTDKKFTELSKQVKQQVKFQAELLNDKIEYQLEETVKVLKNENLNFKDDMVTEIKEIRTETAVNSSHRKVLDNHEQRLTKIERHVFAS
jgi:cyanate lyase